MTNGHSFALWQHSEVDDNDVHHGKLLENTCDLLPKYSAHSSGLCGQVMVTRHRTSLSSRRSYLSVSSTCPGTDFAAFPHITQRAVRHVALLVFVAMWAVLQALRTSISTTIEAKAFVAISLSSLKALLLQMRPLCCKLRSGKPLFIVLNLVHDVFCVSRKLLVVVASTIYRLQSSSW